VASPVKLPTIHLREGRDRPLQLGHPWVLSGSVARAEGDPEPGAGVGVADSRGELLGFGDFDPDSQIRVRIHSFGPTRPDPEETWLPARIEAALAWRAAHPSLRDTDALRLIHSEGDGLPGLSVDRYADWLAVRLTTPGMRRRVDRIAEILARLTQAQGAWLRGETSRQPEGTERELFGSVGREPVQIRERGRSYWIDLQHGQKTGFYLDQRDARDLFRELASGARALDLFSYTGGFAVAALQGGAREVVAVESSKPAHDLLRQNAPEAEAVLGDAAEFLRKDERRFDLIALDPPPFARRKRDVHSACRAYKDLQLWALRRAAPGAHLLAFSCSHHVGPELFRKVALSAALDTGAEVQVLGTLRAPPDHPVTLCHPQGEYLSGLVLRIVTPPVSRHAGSAAVLLDASAN
jgi:23S rRNA (cytosine1962-C5)-methyltransferase